MCKELQAFSQVVFTQEELQLGSKDLPHCGVLPVLGLPAPFITSADQGPLLSFISQKEVFPRRVVRERDIELGSGEAVTAKWVLFHQCLTQNLSLEDKLVPPVCLVHRSLGEPEEMSFLCQIMSLLQRHLV